jgi:transposase
VFHRWQLCHRKKGGDGVGKTKRGKGTKLMAVADGASLPVALSTFSASPHEVTLVEPTLDAAFVAEAPHRLIGDKAYDSDPLDQRLLEERQIELIAPHRRNRKKAKTQDGRKLRRYKRRWKVERLFAWLQNYRRILVRYDYKLCNYQGFVHLGAITLILRRYF